LLKTYFECAETATYFKYRDSKTVIKNLMKAKVSKHRIRTYIQKVGAFIDKERRETGNGKIDMLYADETKAHGIDGKKNKINVIVGKKTETDMKNIFGTHSEQEMEKKQRNSSGARQKL